MATHTNQASPVDSVDSTMTADRQPTSRPSTRADRTSSLGPGDPRCQTLAALSIGGGVIHFAIVPQLAQAATALGVAFAIAGWFQFACGAALVTRPSRAWALVTLLGNLVLVTVWALSRTTSLETWTGDGGVEPASALGVLGVSLEVILAIGAAGLVVAPGFLQAMSNRLGRVVVGVVSFGVLVATTALLLTAGANLVQTDEGHDNAGSVSGPTTPESNVGEPAASEHDHEQAAGTAPADHGHAEASITYEQLPPETKAEVDQVIDEWAHKYPTGADAQKDGWFKSTPSLYGIGSHYIKNPTDLTSVAVPFDMMQPNILLYDGEGPDAKFAGVSYVVSGDIEGFTGPYDVWHAHRSVCIGQDGVTLTEDNSPFWFSESECTASGRRVLPIAADKMIHLWIGSGYTDAPILAHDNPKLYDGYYPKRSPGS